MLVRKMKEMQRETFYLHEDFWAMITLLPAENFEELLRIARTAQAFGEKHFDGSGWTALYEIPKPTHPLALRNIPFSELEGLLSKQFHQTKSVQSGYSSYRETLPHCFAFLEAQHADGGLYGSQREGIVHALHLLRCTQKRESIPIFVESMHHLAIKYDLVLADWWEDSVIDLREKDMIIRYLESAFDEELVDHE